MKQITNKTVLKKGDIIYQPVENMDKSIFWENEDNRIVAQSQPTLKDVPVISIADWYSKLRMIGLTSDACCIVSDLLEINCYTQKDIEKAIDLARTLQYDQQTEVDVESILGSSDGTYGIRQKYTEKQIIKQLNSISVIEVDEQFNVISYE